MIGRHVIACLVDDIVSYVCGLCSMQGTSIDCRKGGRFASYSHQSLIIMV